jgi:hypothetical protein
MNLEKQISKLQKDIKNNVNNINRGGCIHFAYFLSKKLTFLKIPHKIVLCCSSPISPRLEEGVNHVFVSVGNIGFIDGVSTYKYIPDRYYYTKNIKSLQKIDRYRNMSYCWSDLYDVKNNILVEKLIDDNIYI